MNNNIIQVQPKEEPQEESEVLQEARRKLSDNKLSNIYLDLNQDDFAKILPELNERMQKQPLNVDLGKDINIIPEGAFNNCSGMVEFAKNTQIDDGAFYNFVGLINDRVYFGAQSGLEPMTVDNLKTHLNDWYKLQADNKRTYKGEKLNNFQSIKNSFDKYPYYTFQKTIPYLKDYAEHMRKVDLQKTIEEQRAKIDTKLDTKPEKEIVQQSEPPRSYLKLDPLPNKNKNHNSVNSLNKNKLQKIQTKNEEAKQSKGERFKAFLEGIKNCWNCTTAQNQVLPFDGNPQPNTSNLGEQKQNSPRPSSPNTGYAKKQTNFLTK